MESNDYIEFDGVRRYQPDALHKRMLAKIAELEAQLQAAQQWQPMTDYCLVADKIDSNIHLGIMRGGQRFMVSLPGADEEIILDLPDGYAICRKIQPTE